MSNIRGVHVLAEFPCPECGKPANYLSVAGCLPDGRLVDPTEPAGGISECAACRKAQHEKDNEAWKAQRAQRAWTKRPPKLVTDTKESHP